MLTDLIYAMPDPPEVPVAVERVLSPTGVCVMIILAFVVDYLSVGPNSLRDRLAFVLAIVALHDGFDGSPLDRWTVGILESLVGQLLSMTGDAYIAGASINIVIGAGVGIVWIYAIGCMLPEKTPRAGRYAALTWPTAPQFRINVKLWGIALILGMLSDLPQGAVGAMSRGLFDLVAGLVAPIPSFLFGAV